MCPCYAEVDEMQITAPTAAKRIPTAASAAVRRAVAPITRRRARRPLRFPLVFNLAAVALIALAIALAVANI